MLEAGLGFHAWSFIKRMGEVCQTQLYVSKALLSVQEVRQRRGSRSVKVEDLKRKGRDLKLRAGWM